MVLTNDNISFCQIWYRERCLHWQVQKVRWIESNDQFSIITNECSVKSVIIVNSAYILLMIVNDMCWCASEPTRNRRRIRMECCHSCSTYQFEPSKYHFNFFKIINFFFYCYWLQADSLRKKASRVEDENESLMMQLKKMATKARSMFYFRFNCFGLLALFECNCNSFSLLYCYFASHFDFAFIFFFE